MPQASGEFLTISARVVGKTNLPVIDAVKHAAFYQGFASSAPYTAAVILRLMMPSAGRSKFFEEMEALSEKLCLECPLPICDQDRKLPCRYLQSEEFEKVMERLREQKRESEARRREIRREQAEKLRLVFSRLLTEYGTYGKHRELMKAVLRETI